MRLHHDRYDVASEKLARFDGLMDGDHSRLYGYGFSYVYRKSTMLALRFSGASSQTRLGLWNLTTCWFLAAAALTQTHGPRHVPPRRLTRPSNPSSHRLCE